MATTSTLAAPSIRATHGSRAAAAATTPARGVVSPLARRRRGVAARADGDDDVSTRNSDQGIYMRQITRDERDAEIAWLAGMLKLWLDDEWSIQEPHRDLGMRAAEKCTEMRLEGCEEMGSLVMGVAQELIDFDFSDTFVNAFEVANKCSEILMMREGYEVCCINKDDETRQERYDALVAAGEA